MALFTPTEQLSIVNSADPQTHFFVLSAAGSGGLQLSNAEVVQGVNYIATAAPNGPGLITAARAAQVLAGALPS